MFRFNMIKYGEKKLWGRDKGKRIREQITEYFYSTNFNAKNEDILLIDFSAIDMVDFTFASELVCVLIARLAGEMKGKHVAICGMNPLVEENVQVALEKAKQIALVLDNEEDWHLAGKYGEQIREAFETLVRQKSIDTPALAERLGTNIHSINNRLKVLLSFGLLKRTEKIAPSGGIQYIYHSII